MRVSPEAAVELERQFRARQTRRRLTRWGVVALAALITGTLTFWSLGIGRSPPEPASSVSSTPATAADWPMSGRDTTRAASRAEGLDLSGVVAWSFQAAAPFESSPAVVDGVVYAGAGDKRVVALDAKTGAQLWESEVTGPVASSPAVAGDLLYFGLKDGRVVALSTEDGAQVWEYQTGDFIVASPTTRDGIVYIGSSDGRLYALDALTGKRYWSYNTDGRITAGAAVSDAVIAVASEDRRVHILDAISGGYRLDYSIAGQMSGSPVVDDDLVYAASSSGIVTGIDWKQKSLPFEKTARWIRTTLFLWQFVSSLPPQKGYVWSDSLRRENFDFTPALSGDTLYIASDTGSLFALGRADGSRKWRFVADAGLSGGPSAAGDMVYVGDEDGVIYAIGANDGEERWRMTLDGKIVSEPVAAGDTLYVATAEGTLFAVR